MIDFETLINDDWSVGRVSMYDEEGIEGWRWTAPDGEESYVVGNWDDWPPQPPLTKKQGP